MSALRNTILATTRRSNLLAALLGSGGRLDVGAAMHSIISPSSWRSGPGTDEAIGPKLRLKTKSKARAGTKVTLRWSATDATTVTTWRVSLDGKVIGKVSADKAGVSRKVSRTGRHNWRVVGFDETGAKVVAAKRAFRVVKR